MGEGATTGSAFRYTDEQWNDIAKVIPTEDANWEKWTYYTSCRNELETIGDQWATGQKDAMIRREVGDKAEKKLAIKAIKSASRFQADLAKWITHVGGDQAYSINLGFENGIHQFRTEIDNWVATANRQLEFINVTASNHPNREDFSLNYYIEKVLDMWIGMEGKLAVTTNEAEGTITGPLIDFVTLTTGPVLDLAKRPRLTPSRIRYRVLVAAKQDGLFTGFMNSDDWT